MIDQLQNLSIRTFLSLGPYERDKGFRELLGSIARKGLFIIGMLGITAVVIYVASHLLLVGKHVVWHYTGQNAGSEIMLVDKSLILIFCLTIIFLSRTLISVHWCRVLVFVFVWLICLAMLLDDVATRDLTVSPVYISFALIMAGVGIPYSGWQTALMNLTVISSCILVVYVAPLLFNIPVVPLLLAQVIYLVLVAIVLTGMSSLIYLSRYEQYNAQKHAEQLKTQLEDRAHTLEILKAKSEEQAQKILRHEQIKDRFFANISHEFRTPLTLILGPLKDILSRRDETGMIPVKASLLKLMQKNATQLLGQINQLLDLSKIDAGEIQLNIQDTDLEALVSETVLSFVSLAEVKQVRLSYHPPKERLTIKVDPQHMEQAIGNLVSNALKFTPEGGSVDVFVRTSESPGQSVQIKVADTGIGISSEELPYIFDRFYQSAQKPGTINSGTGIGLALVKDIVELHGGTVTIESVVGKGSEFVINLNGYFETATDLPQVCKEIEIRESGSSDLEEWEWPEDEPVADDVPTILVVDDNRDVLMYLQGYLSRKYHVITLDKSSETLGILREQDVALLITDVMMPDPDGFELCHSVKQDEKLSHIPVILLTARAGEESKQEGLELGADDYICKPFSASELMIRIENLIELRRMLRDKYTQEVRIEGEKVDMSSADARFLKQVQIVIEEQMENTNFGVDWLADRLYLSPRHLQRKIRHITGLSAAGYIRYMRLEHASQLLSNKWGNVSEVSYKVGFQDTKYFSRLFRQTFGVTPTEYIGRIVQ
ncbi:MAG TPA: ATP-binding protein [Balneolales bacterium]|nr:ATP-binding protein [Balneolales bacterium]